VGIVHNYVIRLNLCKVHNDFRGCWIVLFNKASMCKLRVLFEKSSFHDWQNLIMQHKLVVCFSIEFVKLITSLVNATLAILKVHDETVATTLNPKPSYFAFEMHSVAYPSTSKTREISNMICEHHFSENTYLVLQNADHAADVINGVAIDNDRRSEVRRRTWNECRWWSAWVDEGWKLVGLFDDMEKV